MGNGRKVGVEGGRRRITVTPHKQGSEYGQAGRQKAKGTVGTARQAKVEGQGCGCRGVIRRKGAQKARRACGGLEGSNGHGEGKMGGSRL